MEAYKQYIVQNTEKFLLSALHWNLLRYHITTRGATTAPKGKTNVRFLSYQPPIAPEPYPMITVSTGNCPRNYPTIWPCTDCPVWSTGGDRFTRAACTGNQASRSFGTSLISLTLSLYMECNSHSGVICEGVGSKQHTPLMRQFQGNHVRTNECV